ncbi:hypothetical protein E5676_scaffold311G00040 [Cucumis melo var. makuwa]|uniref:Uncharacterized protein n=1 Tax=Cucumis melo var. makuwa TaxID=1194695 RepID=A0A5D3DGF0_CUCMM|nr:hypothetical protein E5676_scaffold311G00040 [Cucumis melo var. makuwa]
MLDRVGFTHERGASFRTRATRRVCGLLGSRGGCSTGSGLRMNEARVSGLERRDGFAGYSGRGADARPAVLGDGLQMGFQLARRGGFRSARATACRRGVRLARHGGFRSAKATACGRESSAAGLRGFVTPDSLRRRGTDKEPTRDYGWAPVRTGWTPTARAAARRS